MSREELRNAIQSITERDIQKEIKIFEDNPEKLSLELNKFVDRLKEEDIAAGVKKYDGEKGFIDAILFYIAFKAALVRKGIKLGVAAGAGAAIFFGTGSLGHSIATATGSTLIDGVADGFDAVGDMALDVSDVGLDVAADGLDFFAGIANSILSLFGF